MKRFEYKLIYPMFRTERQLNQLGYDGWEVVASTGSAFVLKREYTD